MSPTRRCVAPGDRAQHTHPTTTTPAAPSAGVVRCGSHGRENAVCGSAWVRVGVEPSDGVRAIL